MKKYLLMLAVAASCALAACSGSENKATDTAQAVEVEAVETTTTCPNACNSDACPQNPAECPKAAECAECPQKGTCPKAECPKTDCPKAECPKTECPQAACATENVVTEAVAEN